MATKSLGQHWLNDEPTLKAICAAAKLTGDDTVLEIGPGQGSLTKHLVAETKKVVAVEIDSELASRLPGAPSLEVVEADILAFDLNRLPSGYKVVANIPYYLTSNLIRILSESANPPSLMVLLVQKEVAERIAAKPGQMSLLSVSVQLYYEVELGIVVPARFFKPPPKVDSRVVILGRRDRPPFKDLDRQKFFRIVKAGFSGRRKKLRSSLAGGLGISKQQADDILKKANIFPDARAQELTLKQWCQIYQSVQQN